VAAAPLAQMFPQQLPGHRIQQPVPAVSARLGHSSVRTTQEIYAHMTTGRDDEAAKAWEEYQRKAGESHLQAESRKV
jgi:hypothetical protein